MAAAGIEPQSSITATVIVVLMLTVVAGGTGIVAGTMLHRQPASHQVERAGQGATGSSLSATGGRAADPHETAGGEGDVVVASTGAEEPVAVVVLPFPPVLTSLAAPPGTWIRIEGSMLVAQHSDEKPEVLVERAAANLLPFLRTVTLSQIEGPSGLLYFRQDINELVSTMSGGLVREVLIRGLVVE